MIKVYLNVTWGDIRLKYNSLIMNLAGSCILVYYKMKLLILDDLKNHFSLDLSWTIPVKSYILIIFTKFLACENNTISMSIIYFLRLILTASFWYCALTTTNIDGHLNISFLFVLFITDGLIFGLQIYSNLLKFENSFWLLLDFFQSNLVFIIYFKVHLIH